ncbi:Wzz/FepE/Etk N-terminal domain-containing protein [Ferrimonas sp. SCSIO 43195]|uniref:Wzz/FepE/Etk N-terminal domain-containing protein n=1 Tax=Ferrimonas sp. SCSIO 43195 TaxID=2822844 RepID=UPI0020759449|nr:Wzz/FepE/Etk N-terminal domain-containing protein [Ferrimonas sp. SCSIO 43195]USD38661.1 LPS O-antigen length regulator [Ferrimonas sp. SCSIO 43195]
MVNKTLKDARFSTDSNCTDIERNDEIDLKEVLNAIWSGKYIVLIITFLSAIIAITISLNLPNIYRSEVLLSPASSEQNSGIPSIAGQFGGLAAMAGINLNSSGNIDKVTLSIEVLRSRNFLSKFIYRHDILIPLMAGNGWDEVTNRVLLDPSIYDEKNESWIREATINRTSEPTAQEAIEKMLEIMSVSVDKNTGMVRVSIDFLSPTLAKNWVDWIISDINDEMRMRDLSEADKSIKYLKEQLRHTVVADMKSVLYQLIEEQSKTKMFAEIRDEYIFKTIDMAVIPEKKLKPKRAIICVFGTFIGFILGVCLVVFRHFYNGSK